MKCICRCMRYMLTHARSAFSYGKNRIENITNEFTVTRKNKRRYEEDPKSNTDKGDRYLPYASTQDTSNAAWYLRAATPSRRSAVSVCATKRRPRRSVEARCGRKRKLIM